MGVSSYKIVEGSKRQRWQIGVLALSELTFRVKPKIKLGIDLEKRHHEVRKLFLKHCSKMCHDNYCDVEDVLQEVYKGILIRNKGTCPYNPEKSSFSTYIVMVSTCVTINYINKHSKKSERECYGKTDSIENEPYSINMFSNENQDKNLEFEEMRNLLKGEALMVFDDLMSGHKVSQISAKRSIDSRKVNKTILEIQKTLHHYRPERAY